MRPARLFAAAAVVLLAAPARSPAESITMALTGFPNGSGNVSLDGTTITAAPIGPLDWTQYQSGGAPFNHPPNPNFPNPVTTFCIELGNTAGTQITPGTPYTFGVRSDLTTAPTIGTQAKANAILELYGRHYDPAWAAAGFTGSAASVAFQLALWELVYDGPGGSLSGGRFSVDPATFPEAATAQSWLNGLTGDTSVFASAFPNMELVALVAPADPNEAKLATPTQDQLALRAKVVPAPPSVLLAGLALGGLAFRRVLRRPTAV
jgi:hypothetical protein